MNYRKIFIGKEVEGPEKGKVTLFIPKNATNRLSFLKVAQQYNIKRLYFGAGNDRGICFDLVPSLLEIPKEYQIYLEITSSEDLIGIPLKFLQRTKVIFVIQKTEYFKVLPSVFKIETTGNVHWYELPYPTTNSINDPLYKKDMEII